MAPVTGSARKFLLVLLLGLAVSMPALAASAAEDAAWDGEWNICKDRLADVLDSVNFDGKPPPLIERTPVGSKPPGPFREALRKPGKFIGVVDNLAIDPIVTYFTTEDDRSTPGDERWHAMFFKALEGLLKIYFPAYGLTLDAGRIIVGNTIVAVDALYEEGHRTSIERMVFGGHLPTDAFLLGNVDDLFAQQSFFGEFLPRHGITPDNIARKIKSEQALRQLWFTTYRSYLMSGVGSIGPLHKPDDMGRLPVDNRLRDGWERLRGYWELKRAAEFGESLRVGFLQRFRAPCIDLSKKQCPIAFSEPYQNVGQSETQCRCQVGYTWNHDRSKCLLEPAAQVAAKVCAPGMQPYWASESEEVLCQCKPGYDWNKGHTQCILAPAAQVAAKVCEGGAEAFWDEAQELALCRCPGDQDWNRAHTACIEAPQVQVSKTRCQPNAEAFWNDAMEAVRCRCLADHAWNAERTACVPSRQARLDALKCGEFYANSQARWDEAQAKGVCVCKDGYRWNEARTSCLPDAQRLVALTRCADKYPQSEAWWDASAQQAKCRCVKGTRWVAAQGACVTEQRSPELDKLLGEVEGNQEQVQAANRGERISAADNLDKTQQIESGPSTVRAQAEGPGLMDGLIQGLTIAVAQSQGLHVPAAGNAPLPGHDPPGGLGTGGRVGTGGARGTGGTGGTGATGNAGSRGGPGAPADNSAHIREVQTELACLLEGRRKYPKIELNCNGNFMIGSRDGHIARLEAELRNAGATARSPAPGKEPTRAPTATVDDWFIIISSALPASNDNYRKYGECQYRVARGMQYVSSFAGGKQGIASNVEALRGKGHTGVEARYFGDISPDAAQRVVDQWGAAEKRGYDACYDAIRRAGGGRR